MSNISRNSRSVLTSYLYKSREKRRPSALALDGERADPFMARAFRRLEVVHFEPTAAAGAARARKRRR
eukprot:scaffold46079_cov75-Phaeocystis_antarctica.AAC.2